MSAEAKQKEEVAKKAKAARELCTKVQATVAEQTKTRNEEMVLLKQQMADASVRQKKLTWCTVVMSTVLLCLAVTSLLLFNTVRDLEKLHVKCVSSTENSMVEVNKLRAEAKQLTSTQVQQHKDVEEKYVQLLGYHNDLVEKFSTQSDQVNKLTQQLTVDERTVSTLEATTSGLTSDMEKLTSSSSLNGDAINGLKKALREMNGTIDEMQKEKSGVSTKCCRDIEGKLSKLDEIHTLQGKVNSLESLLTEKLNSVTVVREEMNTKVGQIDVKLDKLSSDAEELRHLIDERAGPAEEQTKQLEETYIAAMTKFSDSMNSRVEAQLGNLDTATRHIVGRLTKLEESTYNSTGTCSDISECQKSEPLEEVKHDSSEL